MKPRLSLLVLALAASAAAQNVPEKFVVSGNAAAKIQDFTTINLATAERIAGACEKAATAENVGISIMILDNDGNHVYMDRMDGQGYLNIVTAEMKARAALAARAPSKVRMNRVIQDPAAEFEQIQLGIFTNSGGLPIVVNRQLIGVVGVGGSAPRVPVWSDEICAHKALQEVIGQSVPSLAEDLPARRNPGRGNAPVARFAAAEPPKSSLPAEFVVSGKGAATVFDANQISLGAAKKIAGACREFAASKGGAMAAYIIDVAGEFVHMERMDGEVSEDMRTALLKAQTALKTRQPTSIRAAQLKNDPSGWPRSAAFYNFFTESGGIPIVVDGQMIGAVGVSGMAEEDEACAVAGLRQTFGDRALIPAYPAR